MWNDGGGVVISSHSTKKSLGEELGRTESRRRELEEELRKTKEQQEEELRKRKEQQEEERLQWQDVRQSHDKATEEYARSGDPSVERVWAGQVTSYRSEFITLPF